MSDRPNGSTNGPARATAESMLRVKGLKTHFFTADGVVRAVDGVDFEIRRGQTMGLVGESGSGKSVTSLSIMRLISPPGRIVEGEIVLDGTDLVHLDEDEMYNVRGNRISMIFQEPMTSLNPVFTVGDQISEAVLVHQKVSKEQAKKRAVEMLGLVGIPQPSARYKAYPHEMSGGMRQRIVGAIGISCEPRLLIADEPTTSLDLTIQAQYLNLLRELQQAHGLALIFITHNLGIVAKMCDRLAVMYAGRVVEAGPVARIFNAPAHPYTEALLNSIPRISDDRQRLTAIDGQPPDLSALPRGCAFAPRCARTLPHCCEEAPPEFALGDGRCARCWLAAAADASDVPAGLGLPSGALR